MCLKGCRRLSPGTKLAAMINGGRSSRVVRVGVAASFLMSMLIVFSLAPTSTAASPLHGLTAKIPVKGDTLGRAKAISWAKKVPAFPRSIRGYALDSQSAQLETRIFQGDDWEPLRPLNQGLANRCDSWIWVVRWRSRNPDVVLKTSLLDTALPPPYSGWRVSKGGAGYMYGNACASPGLRFGRTLNGNRSNLVDVDYEFQIWIPKRNI